MAAANVRDLRAALELFEHAVERRQPCADEIGAVSGPEEPVDAARHAVAVIAPVQALAALEGFGEPRLVVIDRRQQAEAADHGDRAFVVGEHRRLLRRHREGVVVLVVGDEA